MSSVITPGFVNSSQKKYNYLGKYTNYLNVNYTWHLNISEKSEFVHFKKQIPKFPRNPVVRTLHLHCSGPGSITDWGTKIPQALQHGQKKNLKCFSVLRRLMPELIKDEIQVNEIGKFYIGK